MNTEDKLKDLILKRYYSVRDFTITHDIPYTTMHSIFKRGIGNSSVTNVIKICKALGISADALADGDIVPVNKYVQAPLKDNLDVNEIISETMNRLTHSGQLTLDGEPIDKKNVEGIIDAMEVSVEIAKRKQSDNKNHNKNYNKN